MGILGSGGESGGIVAPRGILRSNRDEVGQTGT